MLAQAGCMGGKPPMVAQAGSIGLSPRPGYPPVALGRPEQPRRGLGEVRTAQAGVPPEKASGPLSADLRLPSPLRSVLSDRSASYGSPRRGSVGEDPLVDRPGGGPRGGARSPVGCGRTGTGRGGEGVAAFRLSRDDGMGSRHYREFFLRLLRLPERACERASDHGRRECWLVCWTRLRVFED